MNALRQRQGGAIAIMYAIMLPAILGCVGLALDLGLCYLRRAQMQNAADSVALIAAKALDGTDAGLETARNDAAYYASGLRVGLGQRLRWRSAALKFATRPDAPEAAWQSNPAGPEVVGIRYARVDTSALEESMRNVTPVLMGALDISSPINVGAVAVAGPATLQVAPLAVCAPSTDASRSRDNSGYAEQVLYGFRTGVGYNLLNLNPFANSPAVYFYVDPIHVAGSGSASFGDATVAPFICSGTIGYPTFVDGKARLRRPASFELAAQLNSRFGTYGGTPACNALAAPPDINIKSYADANANWLTRQPTRLTAKPTDPPSPLRTIADNAPPLPAATAPGDYGILWAYGPARNATGAVATSSFPSLYPSTPPGSIKSASPTYPAKGPYLTGGTSFGQTPAATGRPNRRMLNIPLLGCTAPADAMVQGNVLAIGRFLLTAPASATEVPAEFVGIVTEAAVPATMGLYK
jgi:Putative Flp pilus-assembly TadE/G-like